MPSGSRRKRRQKRSTKSEDRDVEGGSFDEEFLLGVLPGTVSIDSISAETDLQQLWAGYGSVRGFSVRRTVRGDDGEDDEEVTTDLIIKRVCPPPDDGTSVSHARKMRSYGVEAAFYSTYAPRAKKKLLSSDARCAMPRAYAVESSEDPPSFEFLFSDLRSEFPVPDPFRMDRTRTEAALRWLAAFHAVFWEAEDVVPGSLWECGGYWHLDTRLEELDCMSMREWGRLKAGSFAIDRRIRESRDFRTLCHGDFKSANLLFRPDGSECAAVDFQYVGGGYGMKDVVMLIVSSADSGLVGCGTTFDFVRYYHDALVKNLRSLRRVPKDRIDAYSMKVAFHHFDLCLLDYVRFMAGWGFWGENCRYAQDRCLRIMKDMEAEGGNLQTKQGWESAIQKRYPV